MKTEDAQAVITVLSYETRGCRFFCGKGISVGGPDNFDDGINHLISEHGCTLLHVGSETTHLSDGQPQHGTRATLISPVPLPVPPKLEVIVAGL